MHYEIVKFADMYVIRKVKFLRISLNYWQQGQGYSRDYWVSSIKDATQFDTELNAKTFLVDIVIGKPKGHKSVKIIQSYDKNGKLIR